ncbi:MAG TPA: DNA replication/repair protein RecF [Mycobacteriales bacterium]|nr:DNA replication/repair protein RecF [Mycobacteriales bacterium]
MHVSRLAVTDFRSYPAVDLAIPPGVSSFIGPNGQGKTNLLEAVGYIATLSSHRVASDGPLVRLGAERAVLRTVVERDGRSITAELEINPGRANRARVGGAPLPRPRELLGLLRTVLFAPEDLALAKGDPAERRRFLDDLLVARAPRYAAVRADYDRVLKQRNALLKSAGVTRHSSGADLRTLDVWDAHLTTAGAALLAARIELIEALRPLLDKNYDTVSRGGGPTGMDYRSSLGPDAPLVPDRDLLAAAFTAALSEQRSAELARGVSLVGPHRDDLWLRIGELPVRGYASHGECWSLALALRLAGYDLLRADGGEPVLLLDDVFAELDSERRERLAELVGPAEQVLITAAVPDDVPAALAGARFDVAGSEVRRVC